MGSGQLRLDSALGTSIIPERVVYLCPTLAPYHVPKLDALYRGIGEGFTVVSLRHPRLEISRMALSMGAFPRRIIGGFSCSISRRHDEGRATPLWFVCSPSLPLVLRSLKPEIVISNNFNLWTLTSVLMGYPTVLFWEGTHHTERTVGFWRLRLRRWIGRHAGAFVVNGTLSQRYLVDVIGTPADRISQGGMCAEPAPVHVRRGLKSPRCEEPIRFLFVGRLISGKGVSHLLHAAQVLKRKLGSDQAFKICLVGDGPERPACEALASGLGVQSLVHFAGFVPPEQVWSYYEKAHVLVLPTLQDNWPLVVPEAMSMGLPILLSRRAGSVPDLIREGENGYSFEPENHEELASRMEEYVRKPDLVRKNGDRSRDLVSSYSPERAASAFLWAVSKVKDSTLPTLTRPSDVPV